MIDSLLTSGTAQGTDAYRNLLAENLQLLDRKFEKIFCYQVDEPVKENRKILN